MDYDYWLRIFRRRAVGFIDAELAAFRRQPNQKSTQPERTAAELLQVVRPYPEARWLVNLFQTPHVYRRVDFDTGFVKEMEESLAHGEGRWRRWARWGASRFAIPRCWPGAVFAASWLSRCVLNEQIEDMRLTSGALWLRFHQKFGHGLRVAWYRDVVRPRILATPPIADTTDDRCEIHALTSSGDWLNLIWALKSFYLASGRRYALCIHEDGSLRPDDLANLRQHFPAARIIRRAEADAKLAKTLRDFPRSLEFRNTNLLAPKVFDFIAFLESERMVLFDSDLLFSMFQPHTWSGPKSTLQEEHVQRRFGHAYTVEPEEVRELIGHDLLPRQYWLWSDHRNSVKWEWTEEFLGAAEILNWHFWRIEQTLLALCSSRFGADLPTNTPLR